MYIAWQLLGFLFNAFLLGYFIHFSLSPSSFCKGIIHIRVDEMAVWIASKKKEKVWDGSAQKEYFSDFCEINLLCLEN